MKLMKKISLALIGLAQFASTAGQAQELKFQSDNLPYTLFFDGNAGSKQILPFANAVIAASGYAVWTDQIRNGSGNKAKLSDNPTINGYFSQMLQMLSSYDLYFTARVRRMQSQMRHGDSVKLLLASGPIHASYSAKNLDPALEPILGGMSNQVMGSIVPFAGFDVREYPAKDFEYGNGGLQFEGSVLKMQFNQSLVEKYDEIVKLAHVGNSNQTLRLLALAARYMPLATRVDAQIHPLSKAGAPEWKSYSRFEILVPAIGVLNRSETPNDVRLWDIDPIHIDLTKDGRKPIENEYARIHTIIYDGAAKEQLENYRVVRFVLQKNYADVDKMTLTAEFGRQGGSGEPNQIVTMNTSKFSDGVLLLGKPLPPTAIRGWKDRVWPFSKIYESVENLLNKFDVAISVQKLAMNLTREKPSVDAKGNFLSEAFDKDYPFVQHYDPENSRLAFRLSFRSEDSMMDKLILAAAKAADGMVTGARGQLVCNPESAGAAYPLLCEKEFNSMADYSSWMNNATMSFVKQQVDNSATQQLPELQAQLDKLLGDLATQVLESFSQGKRALETRLAEPVSAR